MMMLAGSRGKTLAHFELLAVGVGGMVAVCAPAIPN